MGSFAGEVAEFDFHGTWEAARPTWRQDEKRKFFVQGVEAARQSARTDKMGAEPEEADEVEGVAVADAYWRDAGPARYARHRQAHEIVGKRQSPQLLLDALGSFAAQ